MQRSCRAGGTRSSEPRACAETPEAEAEIESEEGRERWDQGLGNAELGESQRLAPRREGDRIPLGGETDALRLLVGVPANRVDEWHCDEHPAESSGIDCRPRACFDVVPQRHTPPSSTADPGRREGRG